MFSLIITIISILLVAALAIGSIYYGGSAWAQSGAKADASRFLNEASQIEGAIKLYMNDHAGRVPGVFADLTPKYLGALPDGDWVFGNDYVQRTGLSESQCLRVNESVGLSHIPECATAGPEVPCCQSEET